MKNLVNLVMASLLLLFSTSCQQKIENENKFKNWFISAKSYSYLGKEEQALECLDSLQSGIKEEYSKGISKKNIVRLSELSSRGWIERGKIYREQGYNEDALRCFDFAITSYFGDNEKFENISLSWDPILESRKEKAETYEKMGEKEEAKKIRKWIEKYRAYNYSN